MIWRAGVPGGVATGGDFTGSAVGGAVAPGVDLGVGLAAALDGVVSGEFEACWMAWPQPANDKTKPANHAAGTKPLLTRL